MAHAPPAPDLGYKLEVDPELVIPNRNLSIAEGAVQPWARSGAMSPWYYSQLESLARAFDFSLDVPVKDMEKQDIDRVLYGTKRKAIDVRHHTQRGKYLPLALCVRGRHQQP